VPLGGFRRLVALLVLSAVWLLLLSAPALAHARLLETYPAEEAALTKPPEQVQLRFNEPVDAAFSPLKVSDQQDNRVDEDNARISSNEARLLVVDLKEGLPEGSYTVDWHVTSADGHPVTGTYSFAVDSSASGSEADGAEPIESIERSAKKEEAGFLKWGNVRSVYLGILLIGALAVAGFVALRQR